jgi:adenosylhomocysteine nucleosidase
MHDTAMVAALEREVWPLVRSWSVRKREHQGRQFRFYEKENCVLVCGGIGPEPARRATEAVIALYKPGSVWSIGFAGALERGLHVGELLEPRNVIDARDGSRVDTGSGAGVLVSFSSVAGEGQKVKLAKAYGAQAVDMEAASVAKGAQSHGLPFAIVKVISDEASFRMPDMDRFTRKDGKFLTAKFALHAGLRPWMWGTAIRLGRNSAKAARALCEHLERNMQGVSGQSAPVSHAATKGSRT